MNGRRRLRRAEGIVTGYTSRWNPLTTMVNVLVKVDAKNIRIPIDYRQQKFIQNEYPVGSRIEIERRGNEWHIKSQIESFGELRLLGETSFIPLSESSDQ